MQNESYADKNNNAISFPVTIPAVALKLGAQIRAERIRGTIFHVWKQRMLFRYPALVCFPVCLHKAQRYFHISIYPTVESRYTGAIDCSRKHNIFVFSCPTIVKDVYMSLSSLLPPVLHTRIASAVSDPAHLRINPSKKQTSTNSVCCTDVTCVLFLWSLYLPSNSIYTKWRNKV